MSEIFVLNGFLDEYGLYEGSHVEDLLDQIEAQGFEVTGFGYACGGPLDHNRHYFVDKEIFGVPVTLDFDLAWDDLKVEVRKV